MYVFVKILLFADVTAHTTFDRTITEVMERQTEQSELESEDEEMPFIPECPAGANKEEYDAIMQAYLGYTPKKDKEAAAGTKPKPVISRWHMDCVLLTDTEDTAYIDSVNNLFSGCEAKSLLFEGTIPTLSVHPFVHLSNVLSDLIKKGLADPLVCPMFINATFYPAFDVPSIGAFNVTKLTRKQLITLGLGYWNNTSVMCEVQQQSEPHPLASALGTKSSPIHRQYHAFVCTLRNYLSSCGM